MPVCPYAKQARQRQTLRVLECHNFVEFQDKIIEGARYKRSADQIVGCDDIGYKRTRLCYRCIKEILKSMGSHPDDDDEDEPVEFLDKVSGVTMSL